MKYRPSYVPLAATLKKERASIALFALLSVFRKELGLIMRGSIHRLGIIASTDKFMIEIRIKPLSTNKAWKGRRFPSKEYNQFKQDIHYLLPSEYLVPDGKLAVRYVFGVSSKLFDFDNAIKQFQDCLCTKYDFNDRRIYRAVIEKIDMPKGQEFISFSISKY